MKSPPETRLLLGLLDQAFNTRSWHGTNLRGSIRGLSPEAAAWRPGTGRHNIWEIVVHAAYWKYAVWRRLSGARRGSFALEGSNWFRRPLDADPRAWPADVELLDRMHRRLREQVAGLTPRNLARRAPRSAFTQGELVSGAAAHDLYHAGQIQLLKRLRPPMRSKR